MWCVFKNLLKLIINKKKSSIYSSLVSYWIFFLIDELELIQNNYEYGYKIIKIRIKKKKLINWS